MCPTDNVYPSNKLIVETLTAKFTDLKVYNLKLDDIKQNTFNYFIYGNESLKRTSNCKWMQTVLVKAILYPEIPSNFEFDVVEALEGINLFLSNNNEIIYELGIQGEKILQIIEFRFLRPFKRTE